jgi:hypothetical protein
VTVGRRVLAEPVFNGLGKGGDVGVLVESGFELGTFFSGTGLDVGHGLVHGIGDTFPAVLQELGQGLGKTVAIQSGAGHCVFVRQEVGEPAEELGQGTPGMVYDMGVSEEFKVHINFRFFMQPGDKMSSLIATIETYSIFIASTVLI